MTSLTKTLWITLGAACWLGPTAEGGTISARWETTVDQLVLTTDGPYTRVQVEGAQMACELPPGAPSLPSRLVYLVIPAGATFTNLSVSVSEMKVAQGITIYPAQPARTPDEPPPAFVEPDASILQTDAMSPAVSGTFLGTSRVGGYQLAIARLNPVRYNGRRLELYLATAIEVTLSYDDAVVPPDILISTNDHSRDLVFDLVANPQDVDRFSPTARPAGAGGAPPILPAADNTATYLLITSNALASAFQPLVDRRTSQGKPGQLVTTETIQASFTGVDLPEKIRSCVKSYYQNHGTVWVALGGSETIVPPRFVEGSIPVDRYYGCLDGSWNADGDGVYGEAMVDDTDMASEVWVGRIPVQTAAQATAYVNKVERFEAAEADEFSGSLLIGSNLTWYMSGLARPMGYDDHEPVAESEAPMRNLYRNIIHPYWQAMPLHLLFTTYSTWDTVKCGDYGVTSQHMTERLNSGYHYVYLWGSASSSGGAGLDPAMGASLTNGNHPSIMYVTASSTAAYDQQEPCVSEAFLRSANGGAVAYLGATRSAASTDYHASFFFKEVFQNRLATVGQAFDTAMTKEAPFRIYKDNCRSWYLALSLQGDPALSFKGPESGRHLQIISPNGCEVLTDVGDMVIRWNASGTAFAADEQVKLEYSADSGATWLPIPGAEARQFNSRFFIWEGHGLPDDTHYRVRVVSLSSPGVSDASDRDFTIGRVYLLTVQSTPETNLLVSGTHPNYTNYTYTMLLGSPVSLRAPSLSGYNFARWAGANGNTLTYSTLLNLTCQGNKTVTAEYSTIGGARDYYVNDDVPEGEFASGDDNNDGVSASRPVRHIQQVFDRYGDVATVHISAGTFQENLLVSRNYSNLAIEGSGATVIDGGQAGRCLNLTGVGTCFLHGLTLRGGYSDAGGAIQSSAYSLAVSRCELIANTATSSGGAIRMSGAFLDLDNCTLAGNSAPIGGAIDSYNVPVFVTNSLLHSNSAGVAGGAAAIRGNAYLALQGCTLSENTAGQKGGGLFLSDSSIGQLKNSILWQNHGLSGAQVYLAGAANLTVSYSDIEGSMEQVGRDPQATLTWLDGNISADPVFIGAGAVNRNPAAFPDSDFHISVRSPCRGTGDPQFAPEFLESDLDGEPRIQSGLVDMGVDEAPRLADLDDDGDVDRNDQTMFDTCSTGPGIPYDPLSLPPGCSLTADGEGCVPADFDGDHDIDHADFAIIQTALTIPTVRPDLDRDFDVDQTDTAILQACMMGPGAFQADPACRAADLDLDSDVDQTDFGLLQACLSGEGVPPDPHCL